MIDDLKKWEFRLRGCLLILRAVNCVAAFIVVVTLSKTPGVLAIAEMAPLDFPVFHHHLDGHGQRTIADAYGAGMCYFIAMVEPKMLTDAKEKMEAMAQSAAHNIGVDVGIDGSSMHLKKDLGKIGEEQNPATCGISEDKIESTRTRILENLVNKSLQDKCLPNLFKRDECNCPYDYQDLCPMNGALEGEPIQYLTLASVITAYLWILKCIDFCFDVYGKNDDYGKWEKKLWAIFNYIFLSLTANQILSPLGSVGTVGKQHIMLVKTVPGWGIILILAMIISPLSLVLFVLAAMTLNGNARLSDFRNKEDCSLRGILLKIVLFITCIACLCLLVVVVLLFFNNIPSFFLDLSFVFSIDFSLTFSVPAILVKWFLYILSIGDTVTFAMKLVRLAREAAAKATSDHTNDGATPSRLGKAMDSAFERPAEFDGVEVGNSGPDKV